MQVEPGDLRVSILWGDPVGKRRRQKPNAMFDYRTVIKMSTVNELEPDPPLSETEGKLVRSLFKETSAMNDADLMSMVRVSSFNAKSPSSRGERRPQYRSAATTRSTSLRQTRASR